jgi:hypothetical protein
MQTRGLRVDPYPRVNPDPGSGRVSHFTSRVRSRKKFTGTGRPGFTRRFVAILETSGTKKFTGSAGRTSLFDAAGGLAALTRPHHDILLVLRHT